MKSFYSYIIASLVLSTFANSLPKIEDVSDSVFGAEAFGYMLGAIVDFNGDKATDLLVISENRNEIGVILMEPYGITQYEKLRRSQFVKLVKSDAHLNNIISVMPGDINGDKNIDFYVVTSDEMHGNNLLHAFFCKCNGTVNDGKLTNCDTKFIRCKKGQFDTLPEGPHAAGKSVDSIPLTDQPMVLDVDGNWLPDVVAYDGESQRKSKFRVFVGVEQLFCGDDTICKLQEIDPSKHFNLLETVEAPIPNLFASFDKEMSADIMLGRSIYMNEGEKFVNKMNCSKWPGNTIGLPNILSIENPVTQMEIVLPTCDIVKVHDYFSLCGQGQLKRMAYVDGRSECEWKDLKVELPSNVLDFAWVFPAPSNNLIPPPTVRSGDFDLDGFTDLVAVVALKQKDSILFDEPTIALFRNVVCNGTSRCFEMIDLMQGRQKPLGLYPAVATFLDVTPAGRLAVLATHFAKNGSTFLKAYYVHAEADLAFLKISISVYDPADAKQIIGANLPGTMVRCQISSKKSKVALLPRSSHMALAMPYAVFGLGQLPPYVDELSVRLTTMNKSTPDFNHPLIIPNSQLVLIAKPNVPTDQWQLQSFLLINWYMFAVLVLLGIMTGVSFLLLGGLQIRDKQIEKKEKEEEAQHFHFDGM